MPWRHTEEWRYSSTFLDFCTRWRWGVSFTFRPLVLLGNRPRYPLIGSCVGPRACLNAVKNRKIIHCRESNPGLLARRPSPYRLSYPTPEVSWKPRKLMWRSLLTGPSGYIRTSSQQYDEVFIEPVDRRESAGYEPMRKQRWGGQGLHRVEVKKKIWRRKEKDDDDEATISKIFLSFGIMLSEQKSVGAMAHKANKTLERCKQTAIYRYMHRHTCGMWGNICIPTLSLNQK
jgi:hypothetical protein